MKTTLFFIGWLVVISVNCTFGQRQGMSKDVDPNEYNAYCGDSLNMAIRNFCKKDFIERLRSRISKKTLRSVDNQMYVSNGGLSDEEINNIDYDFINAYFYNTRLFKRSFDEKLDGITKICCHQQCSLLTLIQYCPKRDIAR